MHRFYVPGELPAGGVCRIEGEAAHRVTRVLRMQPGERLRLFDGTGREVEGMIAGLQGGAVAVAIERELPPEAPEMDIRLCPALIRPNRFELLLEKATEMGVASVHPLISERCQVHPAQWGAAKTARWRRILVEAAEQSGRRSVPALAGPLTYQTVLRRQSESSLVVLPWEDARHQSPRLGDALRRAKAEGRGALAAIALVIGPEGGFSAQEVAEARERGALVVSLGARVLRAETAALAALAIAGDALAIG